MSIKLKKLPSLLKSMKETGYVIDSFPFIYKENRYIVILKIFKENERKPTKYSKVKLEFIKSENINESIFAYADFINVSFNTVEEFVQFFNIEKGEANRDLFIDFSETFAEYIPVEKIIRKNDEQIRRLQASRCEANSPNALYCYDVQRNGSRNGILNQRSIENSNKAETLRPELYERYKDDKNLSFYFSEYPECERSDEEIINIVANRP